MSVGPINTNNLSLNTTPQLKKEVKVGADPTTLEVGALQLSIAANAQKREQAIEELNKTINAVQGPQKALEISVHEETHAIMIKVKNKETGELIREAPPEKILNAVATLMEVSGLIVDKKV